ncbi:hypothetical protein LCGC14_1495540 [marine sediment metagenome]|uniref:Uncharacterized protein n=1 Tax=marine sediment metagenome TaxID=412755 RepID=A0A0F9JRG5_9ZZZZ
MTKAIRINSCEDCDPYKNYGTYCGKDRAISIHYYVFHKTLPDNCPLDDEGEDIYTGTEGELITFKNKDKSAK